MQAFEYIFKFYVLHKKIIDILELKGNMQLGSETRIGEYFIKQYVTDKFTLYLYNAEKMHDIIYKFIEYLLWKNHIFMMI